MAAQPQQPFVWSTESVSIMSKEDVKATCIKWIILFVTFFVPWIVRCLLVLCRAQMWSLYLTRAPVREPVQTNRPTNNRHVNANRVMQNKYRRRKARHRRDF